MKILNGWKRGKYEFAKEYKKERAEVDILIERCLELSVDAVIIADDLAGERSPFVDPTILRISFAPFIPGGL